MKQYIFLIAIFLLLGGAWLTYGNAPVSNAVAAGEHDEGGNHNEEDEHHEHNEGEEEHGGHGEEHGGHSDGHKDEDGHGGHDEHEEGKTEINPDAAEKAGIVISKASSGTISEVVSLTGRIGLNRDSTAEVRARFPGVVKNVDVKLGQKVKKGEILATVESNESLKTYSINSPTSGVILKKNTNVGNVAGENPLFTIANLSNVWAEFHVFPRDLDKIKEGQMVRVHTLEDGRESESPITLLLPTADPLSQTVIAVVTIDNEEGKWRPGMTVEGDVHVSKQDVSVAVTEEAIQRMEDETVLFVKEGDAYEMRPVKLGKSDGKNVEIIEGLKAGESYVSQGSFIVKADIGKAAAKHEH